MKKRLFLGILLLLVTVGGLLFLVLYSRPLRIGFVGDFSPRYSTVIVPARNVTLMAIEGINAEGGIRGKRIELVQKNNEGNEELCEAIIREMEKEGIPLIIGPFFSNMAIVAKDVLEGSDTISVSPLSSSEWVRGEDDNIININTSGMDDGRELARIMVGRGDRIAALFYSGENLIYTGSVIAGIKEELIGTDSRITHEYLYSPGDDLRQAALTFNAFNPDAILFSATGRDVAAFLQQYALIGDIPQTYGCNWASNTDVMADAGHTAEGMILIDDYLPGDNPGARAKEFQQEYFQRFSAYPEKVAAYTWDAVMLIRYGLEALPGRWDAEAFKDAVIAKGEFEGIYQNFRIDEKGDGSRDKSLYIIREGRYQIYADH